MRKIAQLVNVLLLSFGVSVVSSGKGVDETTAKNAGCHYLISHGIHGVQTASDLAIAYVATATVAGNTIVDYYVFNIVNGTGFVMVAGDDIVAPVLAYSGEASFDINKISPDAKWWIEGYQNQITYVIEHAIPAEATTAAAWTSLQEAPHMSGARTTTVSPLLTTLWDQVGLYPNLCPSGTPTGCVATAMAQIMKYNNWPTIGNGYHSYTSTTNHYNLSADFGNTAYGWSTMGNTINSTNKTAIGTLMFHAGVSVNMDYTSAESGAYTIALSSPITNCAEYAFKSYFHYKRSLTGIPRSGGPGGSPAPVTTTNWISILKAEMDAHRPVLYSGSSITAGGHAWVCDGYDASSQMHFNWGWGGAGPNGYYSVNMIAPTVLGTGGGGGNFNNNQDIIIGITPDSFGTTNSGNLKMLSHVDHTSNMPIQYASPFSVKAKLLNSNSSSFSGDFSAQVFDTLNNNLMGIMQTMTGQTVATGDSTASLTFSTTGLYGMVPGGYYGIRIMYRPTGTSTWTPVADNGTFINYNLMLVSNTQNIRLYDSLHVGSHTVLRGQPATINTKIANYGGSNFSGTIQATLIDVLSGASYPLQVKTGQNIPSNGIVSFTFTTSAVMAPGGRYALAIQHQPGGSGAYTTTGCTDVYQNPILFTVVTAAGINTVNAASDNVVVYPNPAHDMLSIALNGASVDNIRIIDMQGRLVDAFAADNKVPVITIPVNNYAAGMYIMQLVSGTNVITKKIVVAK